jgi:hypothetical protein
MCRKNLSPWHHVLLTLHSHLLDKVSKSGYSRPLGALKFKFKVRVLPWLGCGLSESLKSSCVGSWVPSVERLCGN